MNNVGESLWNEDLLSKYDVRGPRYTSYPGAQVFGSDFNAERFTQYLENRVGSPEPLGLYVHIPFCSNICYFCACNKLVTRDRSKLRTYLDYLKKEASLLSEFPIHREITSLHLGGGTPNFLDGPELTELIFHLSKCFQFSDDQSREFSIEVDPQTVSIDDIRLMAGLGFNRISMGVQDFDPKVQEAINLNQPVEKVASLIRTARETGFRSVNYDLMYGLPYQSEQSFTRTIEHVLQHEPDRIALYNYAHLPDRFPTQRAIERLALPSAQEKLHLLCTAANQLQSNGYHYIGMDHFARIGSDMDIAAQQGKLHRNFQGYAVQSAPETLGLGLSAISSFENCYSQNEKSLDEYYAALDMDRFPVAKGVALSQDDHIRAKVIQSLICQLKVDKQEIEAEYDIVFDQYFSTSQSKLAKAQFDGLILNDGSSLVVTPLGRLLLRNICMLFDMTLIASEGQFSRTI